MSSVCWLLEMGERLVALEEYPTLHNSESHVSYSHYAGDVLLLLQPSGDVASFIQESVANLQSIVFFDKPVIEM
jgi:hypothetical protein